MRIERFAVQGHKNLTREICLEGLGSTVVVHGPNNVGKSNLLEALWGVFRLLKNGKLPLDKPEELRGDDWLDVFTIGSSSSIRLEVEMTLEGEPFPGLAKATRAELAIRLDPGPPRPTWSVDSMRVDDTEYAGSTKKAEQEHAGAIARELSRAYRLRGGGPYRVQMVGHQRLDKKAGIDQALLGHLYDLQESAEADDLARWQLFKESAERFRDVLGASTVRATFDRHKNEADLVLEDGTRRIPLRLLGTGIQQLLLLLGTLLTTGADVVLMEEPESNLSFLLQQRLRDVLAEIVEDPRGPSQIWFTSHSPGFQIGSHFFVLRPTKGDGPELLRRPATEASQATGLQFATRAEGTAPYSWVGKDGLVALPRAVMDKLGLAQGGGIAFLPSQEGGLRLVTDAQALQELGMGEE